MSFVNTSLFLLGSLFVAVPIVLHLAMRPKPKHQVFPALRFVRQRQATNQRRLRLRQALLLLLRCLAIGVLALALARPSVASAQLGGWLVLGGLGFLLAIVLWLFTAATLTRRGWPTVALLGLVGLALFAGVASSALALVRNQSPILLGDRQAAVAAVLLVDTSPRMSYRFENQTRLQRAQEIARWLLRQLPADSQVAVFDSARGVASFSVDLGAAAVAVDALDVTYLPQPWSRLLEDALTLLDSSDRPRKELYVFSDLTRETWDDLTESRTPERFRDRTDVTVQVIDLSVEGARNDAISELQLSQSSLTPGSPLKVRARVARQGTAGERSAVLYLEPPNAPDPIILNGQPQTPEPTLRGRQTIALPENGDATAMFSLASLPYGTQHGYVELEGTDNLDLDNRMSFTVHVRAPWSVLIVAAEGTEPFYITERLAPLEFRQAGRAKFECKVIPVEQLSQQRLADFAAVALLDPPPLDDSVWRQLQQFVQRGGGLVLSLGRNTRSAQAFNSAAALELLPAAIQRQWRDEAGLVLTPRDFDHPILSALSDLRSTIPWEAMPVFRHWVVGPLSADARVLLPLSNNKPAVLERFVGEGRVVMVTTPLSDPDRPRQPAWNWLPQPGEQSWPFMVLVDRLFLYLVQSKDAKLDYWVGQPAQLPSEASAGERVSVFTPRGTWQELTAAQGSVQIPFTEMPGVYRLRTQKDSTLPRGFSVALAPGTTRLTRLDQEALAKAFGTGRVRIARTEAEIVREIDQARIGKEFYPFLLPLLVVVLALEHVTANRLYPNSPGGN